MMMTENKQNMLKCDSGCAVGVNGMRGRAAYGAEKLDESNTGI